MSYKSLFEKYRYQISKGSFDVAEKILDEIKKINPAMGWYHHALLYPMHWGKNESKAKIYSKQIEYLKKSLSYNEKNPHSWRALGGTYFQFKKYKEAESALRQSLKYCRSGLCKTDGLRFLGSILIAKGELERGFTELNKALKSRHRPPYIQLARHFIDYYNLKGNQEMVNYWAKKGIMSAKIIEKSGKQAYGPKNIYRRIIKDFEEFIK